MLFTWDHQQHSNKTHVRSKSQRELVSVQQADCVVSVAPFWCVVEHTQKYLISHNLIWMSSDVLLYGCIVYIYLFLQNKWQLELTVEFADTNTWLAKLVKSRRLWCKFGCNQQCVDMFVIYLGGQLFMQSDVSLVPCQKAASCPVSITSLGSSPAAPPVNGAFVGASRHSWRIPAGEGTQTILCPDECSSFT